MSEDGSDPLPDGPRFADLIGLEFTDSGEGYSVGRLEVTDELLNPHDVLHGSVMHAMADTGMGAALYPGLDEDELCATIEIKISYLRPVTGGVLTCETNVFHRGSSIAHLDSDVRAGDDLVARATGSYSIFTP